MKRLLVCVLIFILAAIVYESEAIAGGEDEKNTATPSNLVFLSYQRSDKTGITMEVIEANGEKHRLKHGQTYRWSPLDSRYNSKAYLALALRGDDGLIRYLWLPMIKRIEKIPADKYKVTFKYKVTLTDGRSIEGKWEPAHQIYYYHESKDPRIVGEVMQEDQPRWASLSTKYIQSLTIDTTSGPDFKAIGDKNLPKTHLAVKLTDGRIFHIPSN